MATTPLRRSTRGIPLVSPAAKSPFVAADTTTYRWLGEGSAGSGSASAGEEEAGRMYYQGFMRVTEGRQRTGKAGPSGASSSKKGKEKEAVKQLMFRVGDGVLIGTVGDIGVAVLTRLWEQPKERGEGEEDEGEDDDMDDRRGTTEKMCEIRWCYRKKDLPGVMGKIQLHEYEILYATSMTKSSHQTVPLTALVHTCTIISSEAFRELYPYYHESYKGRSKYVAVESSSGSESDGSRAARNTSPESADADNHPPTLTLTLSDRIFRRGRGTVSLVYYCTRAFDKFAPGGRGRAWWEIDVAKVLRRGREEGVWDVERPKMVEAKAVEPGHEEGTAIRRKRRRAAKRGRGRAGKDVAPSDDSGSDAFEQHDGDSSSESDAATAEEEESLASADEARLRSSSRKRKSKTAPSHARPTKAYKSASLARAKAKARARAAADTNTFTSVPLHLLPADPHERALHLLHVGATPDSLPKRETEYLEVLSRVQEGVETGNGSCLYIAGVPGTGKTATVHAVIKDLRRQVEEYEIPPFSYVEINGLKIPTPHHAYAVLWDAISGTTGSSAKTALRSLEEHFGAIGKSGGIRGPRGHTFVVLMDELDQLLTAKQDVVYNFFNWPTLRDSQLFVIAVANRMDLPQQLAAKVKSRLGMQSLYFQPYDREALMAIAQSRLVAHPNDPRDPQVLHPEAIRLAAMKMAGTNGDARRVLDACRRAVEVAIETSKKTGQTPTVVSVKDMQNVLKALTSSPVAVFIKQCSLYEKVLLAAILRCVRREGVPEVSWLSVCRDSDNLIKSMFDSPAILSNAELQMVFSSLLATRTLTYSNERYKIMDDRKLALGLGMDANEVGRVLMAEGESWARVLAGL